MGTTKKRKFNNQVNKKEIMVKRKPLNAIEKLILNTIFKKDVPMTPNALANETGLAYVTVRKYIDKMLSEGILVQEGANKPIKAGKGKRSESKKYAINSDMWC